MLIDGIKIIQLGAKKEFQVLAHSQLDLVRLELLEIFFKQSYVRKSLLLEHLAFFSKHCIPGLLRPCSALAPGD